ncbi:MAG: hypothetical protein HY748_01085 [Elusimicrobia bacterium]|nr:hypothetical protein [Elusimicrobiota bacterium]
MTMTLLLFLPFLLGLPCAHAAEGVRVLEGIQREYASAPASARPHLEDAAFSYAVARLKARLPSGPSGSQDAVLEVLRFMHDNLRFATGPLPASQARDCCQWSAKAVLAAGNYNGCVEIAKVFQELLKASAPGLPTLFVSSFDWEAARDGGLEPRKKKSPSPAGHALIEVRDPKAKKALLVDPGVYEPGRKVTEDEIAGFFTPDPARRGIVLQLPEKGLDLHISKESGRYALAQYRYGYVFRREALLQTDPLDSLDVVNAELAELRPAPTWENLVKAGTIRSEDPPGAYMMGNRKFEIFDRSPACPFKTQAGPKGSDAAALRAIRKRFR